MYVASTWTVLRASGYSALDVANSTAAAALHASDSFGGGTQAAGSGVHSVMPPSPG